MIKMHNTDHQYKKFELFYTSFKDKYLLEDDNTDDLITPSITFINRKYGGHGFTISASQQDSETFYVKPYLKILIKPLIWRDEFIFDFDINNKLSYDAEYFGRFLESIDEYDKDAILTITNELKQYRLSRPVMAYEDTKLDLKTMQKYYKKFNLLETILDSNYKTSTMIPIPLKQKLIKIMSGQYMTDKTSKDYFDASVKIYFDEIRNNMQLSTLLISLTSFTIANISRMTVDDVVAALDKNMKVAQDKKWIMNELDTILKYVAINEYFEEMVQVVAYKATDDPKYLNETTRSIFVF